MKSAKVFATSLLFVSLAVGTVVGQSVGTEQSVGVGQAEVMMNNAQRKQLDMKMQEEKRRKMLEGDIFVEEHETARLGKRFVNVSSQQKNALPIPSDDQLDAACPGLLAEYENKYKKLQVKPTNEEEDPFVFFLHVPRTAGKTYATCFLTPLLPPSLRCMPCYDFFRLPQSQKECRFMVSHDDLSVLEQFPGNNNLVVTQLRNPVQRLISSYEFGVEIAGRRIHMSESEALKKPGKNITAINTLNVWPWSHIVPFFRWDLRARMDNLEAKAKQTGTGTAWETYFDDKNNRTYYFNRVENKSYWEKPPARNVLNPYDNVLAMPLKEWIETHEAEELIHNGATLQVLGITNTSFWPEAGALRKCFNRHAPSRARFMELAKEKLAQMPHVGLQEQLDESAASLAVTFEGSYHNRAHKGTPLKSYHYDYPGTDLKKMIVHESKLEGRNVTLTVFEARRRGYVLAVEGAKARKELKVLEPQLRQLVKTEEMWLADKEKRDKLKVKKEKFVKIKEWLGKIKSIILPSKSDYDEDDNVDNALKDSPFNSRIVALDHRVHGLQQRDQKIREDYHALMNITEVKGVPFDDNVTAHLPFDDIFSVDKNKTLGQFYQNCSREAYKKGNQKRDKSLSHLRTPLEESFYFSSKQRKNIDEAVIERIKELNSADMELYEFGKKLFEKQKMPLDHPERHLWMEFPDDTKNESPAASSVSNDNVPYTGGSSSDNDDLLSYHAEL